VVERNPIPDVYAGYPHTSIPRLIQQDWPFGGGDLRMSRSIRKWINSHEIAGSGTKHAGFVLTIAPLIIILLFCYGFAVADPGPDPNASSQDAANAPVLQVTSTDSANNQNTATPLISVTSTQDGKGSNEKAGLPAQFTIRQSKKRPTQAELDAAADRFNALYEPVVAAAPGGFPQAGMDPGGIPHYFGPYPNYANSPMPKGPITGLTADAGGSGYSGNTTALVMDVYETGSGAIITPQIVAGVITGFTINNPGTNYTAPRIIITDADGTGTGAAASATIAPDGASGIRKFVDTVPGLDPNNPNSLGQFIPVAVPDQTSFPPGGIGYTSVPTVVITDRTGTGAVANATIAGGKVTGVVVVNGGNGYTDNPVVTFTGGGATTNAIGKATVSGGVITAITLVGCDYYVIELGEFSEQLHPDLPPTRLRGYRQVNVPAPLNTFHSLGPMIVAERDRPVRVRFINNLPTGSAGNLFLPVDKTVMGAGMGPLQMGVTPGWDVNYTENRATLHLHGGLTPWISDGTPHQWTTPAGEQTDYPRGVSVYNVPDMPDGGPNPPQGVLTFYYDNQQSARLLFYHDHAHGITRLNVYAGEAAGYLLTDPVEQDLINGTNNTGVNPNGLKVLPDIGIPLIIQDKTFVDASTIAAQDPTWNDGTTPPVPNTGDLWYPHVYMPVQNPGDPSGINPYGRWHYGPWFWPPTSVAYGPVLNPYYQPDPNLPNYAPWEPMYMPGTPNPSMAMEGFMDTSIVNGAVYPVLEVEPRAYRFRILNAADDRFFNLQLYVANTSDYLQGGYPTEVSMVPAAQTAGFPANWPTDGRVGGVPDPATRGPDWIQVGNEGGFLPAPAVVPCQPVGWNNNPTTFNFGNVNQHSLLLGCAERADVVVDFSSYAGKTLIMYNDAPAAFPALVPQYDYYTGKPDLTDTGGTPTTYPGYGPNTRTIMQIRVGTTVTTPTPDVTLANLQSVFAKTAAKRGVFEVSQPPIIVPSADYNSAYNESFPADTFVRIHQTSHTFLNLTKSLLTMNLYPMAIQDEMGEAYDEYGRMSGFLGLQYKNPQGQQNLLLYGYESPPLEMLAEAKYADQVTTLNDGTQIWKITHNGVDTHPVHWHLVNVQLINSVAWDNIIVPPDPNELGWKETVRIDPLQDTIVAMRAVAPTLPFEVPNSYRPLDPTMPLGAPMRSSPGGGNAWFDPTGEPVQVLNHIVNFGWEYVFHCHILAHEEMDMMHPLLLAVAPKSPANLTAVQVGSVKNPKVNVTWLDASVSETGFYVERATGALGPWTPLAFLKSTTGPQTGAKITYTDSMIVKNTTYYYRALDSNVIGDTTVYAAPAVGYPHMEVNSTPSNTASLKIGSSSVGTYFNGVWYIDINGNFIWDAGDKLYQFGMPGSVIPIVSDWNSSGSLKLGILRNGVWYVDYNGNHIWDAGDKNYFFGAPGDYPVTGDWNNDMKTEIGVFRNGAWYLDTNADHLWNAGDNLYNFGAPGDIPVVGDWNGDTKPELGVFRNGAWYVDTNADHLWNAGDNLYNFGISGDKPILGDWNGDTKQELGAYRNGVWYVDTNANHIWDSGDDQYTFGMPGAYPVTDVY
jgi:FtsP/CotA-like multicopper oxidase with cupredoxin domain